VPHAEKLERLRIGPDPQGRTPVIALLHGSTDELNALVDVAVEVASGAKLLFLFVGGAEHHRAARQLREIVDPYLLDEEAQAAFRTVQARCGARVSHRLVYAAGEDDWTTSARAALRRFDGHGRVVLLPGDADDIGAPAAQVERLTASSNESPVLWTMADSVSARP
jgi:hypothetical protein